MEFTLGFRLNDLRPSEFYVERAMRFTQALHDQHTYSEAMRGVADEAAGFNLLRTERPPDA